MLHALMLATFLMPTGDSVPLYTNLGTYHHAISTKVPRAQQYFDQGLRLAYGFNHEEAIRSFKEAARLDPKCAICWWGVAYAYGPNINLPMDADAGAAATDAMQRAQKLRAYASPRETAYIEALGHRYGDNANPKGDSAYATAMQGVAKFYPSDIDALVLSAEARMLLRPWTYWQPDGSPYPGTAELVATLERAIKANPNHPGACHFYIHAMEANDAAKAVPCAERLPSLMPGAGHLVHMPGHIYIRVGRWNDAIEANVHALHADETYFEEGPRTGLYPIAYYPHNHAFLAFAAAMAGRSALAIEHARGEAKAIPVDAAKQFGILQPSLVKPMLMEAMFGKWQDIVSEPDPPAELRIARGLNAYAKGLAHAAMGHGDVARTYLDTLRAVTKEVTSNDGAPDVALDVALHALMAEIAYRANDLAGAAQHFRVALELQKGMTYNEPPDWYYPIEQSLGAVLLQQNKAAEAEQLYRQDLKLYPDNVWSLTGLQQALVAQNKTDEAKSVAAKLDAAKSAMDVTLTKSHF